MNKIADWVKQHQIAAFFIITFTITWGLGFSYSAIYKGIFLLAPLAFIATCGPALAGIIISTISNIHSKEGEKRTFRIAFLVAWVVSGLVFLANNTFINHAPLSPVLAGLTFIVVLPVAFVISMAYSRIPTVRNYLSSLTRPRGVWGWSFLALTITPTLILISIPISSLLGRQTMQVHAFPDTAWALIGLIVVKFLYQFFFFNATGEEAGWRGFALPRLQGKVCPLLASLFLALLWAPWHLFLWQAEGKPVFTGQYWLETYINLIPATFLLVWIYNRSRGSILVAGIFHASANTTFFFLNNLDLQMYNLVLYITVIIIIVLERMWKKLPADHPAVFRSPQTAPQPGVKPTPALEH